MATTVSGVVKNSMTMSVGKSIGGVTRSFSVGAGVGKTQTWTSGAGAAAVNTYFEDQARVLTSGANESLDLAGVLTNFFGETITNARVKYVYIENTSATETLTVGNAASPALLWFGAAAHTIAIPPLGYLEMSNPTAAGWVITAGTADLLKIANSGGGSTTYKILILGADA